MRLSGSVEPPFLQLPTLVSAWDLQAGVAGGRPIIVLAAWAGGPGGGRRFIAVIDAADGSDVLRIGVDDWALGGSVRARLIGRDGDPYLLGVHDYGVRLWRIPDGRLVSEWKPRGQCKDFDVLQQGDSSILAMVTDRTLRRVDATTGREVAKPVRPGGRLGRSVDLYSVAIAGPYVFAGDAEGGVWRWDAASGQLAEEGTHGYRAGVWRQAHVGPVIRMSAHAAAGRTVLVTTGSDNAVMLWDIESGHGIRADISVQADVPRTAPHPGAGPARDLLVVGDWTIWRFDAATGEPRGVIARWETGDGSPRTEDHPDIDEIRTLNVNGVDAIFAATTTAIWRLNADSGAAWPP